MSTVCIFFKFFKIFLDFCEEYKKKKEELQKEMEAAKKPEDQMKLVPQYVEKVFLV